MKATWLFALLLLFGLASCNAGGPESSGPEEATVFAAASLTDAFTELATEFEARNEGADILLNFAGSSLLAAQLREGAEADVFASANPMQMQAVVDAGLIDPDTVQLFTANRLTVVVPADNPAGISALEDLARPGVALLLAAPGVPVRQYTDEILARLPGETAAAVYDNLVSEESNVRQVAAKIALGEADAGVVYTSDITADIAGQVRSIAIPETQNVVATYPIAPLRGAPQPEMAARFIEFILSPDGQAILAAWGFAR